MSAREKLFEAMAGGWSLTQTEAANLNQVIEGALCLHAHELAEEIRAEKGSGTYEPAVMFRGGMDYAADLIDPQASAGPVRPDEEPT